MSTPLIIIIAILFIAIGGITGFYISQKYFPKFDYGYTNEGGNKIVTRIKNKIQPETFKLTNILRAPKGMTLDEFKKRKMVAEVSVIVEEMPNKDSKYLKKGTVSINVPGYSSWEIWSDEGSIGAGDQAPCPLDYLTLGTALCLTSHLRLAAEGMKLDPGNIKVEQRSYYAQYGNFGKEGTYGTTENIITHILINSKLPQDDLLKWIRISQNNCYASEGFSNITPIESKIFINGQVVKGV